MSQIKRNALANLVGGTWTMVLAIFCIPLYIKFLGIEAYGLIGVFAVLQCVLGIMDMGLGLTLNREMARLSALPGKAQEQRDLLRTLEIIYWGLSLLGGALVFLLAPLIAHRWVNPASLSMHSVENAVRLMSTVVALQIPSSLYQSGLMGLQRQVLLNSILVAMTSTRGVGALLVLWLVSPTIQAFFAWQLVVSALQTGTFAFVLWGNLPSSSMKPKFEAALMYGISRFAAPVSGNAVVGILLTQLDKVILSRLLTLEMFGYYTLAGTVASTIWGIINPVNSAAFPKFSHLAAQGDHEGLAALYHRVSQYMSVMISPLAVVMTLFSYEIMLVWTHSAITAQNTYLLVSLLVVGTMLNGLASVPGYLQAAAGWPQLIMHSNLVAGIILVPSIVFMVKHYGAVGAACVWVMLNSGYVLITVPIMHSRLLKQEKWRWYSEDLARPLAGAWFIAGIARWLIPEPMSYHATLISVAMVFLMSFMTAALVASEVRTALFSRVWSGWPVYSG